MEGLRALFLMGGLMWGYLSYNPTLLEVGLTRQTRPTLAPIPASVDVASYA
jgi:hypothetical protein